MKFKNKHKAKVLCKDVKKLTREEWLKFRKLGLGGSDVGAICGFSKYKSPYAIYLDKISEEAEEKQNEKAYWGQELENLVAKEFGRATGKRIRRNNKMLIHPQYDFMIANLDREIVGENAILEIKTTSVYNEKEWEGDKVPNLYILQCQHYLAVTGADKCYIACLIGGQKFIWKEILRDNELIDYLINIEREFWEENVLKRVEPSVIALDSEIIKKRFGFSNGESINLDLSFKDKLIKLEDLKNQIKNLESQVDLIENEIKNVMQNNEVATLENYLITWKNSTTKSLDTARLKTENYEIYESYLKEKNLRRFCIKNTTSGNNK